MSAYTPGPWYVEKAADGRSAGYIREATARDIGASSGMHVAIARVTFSGREFAEWQANACLIAQAPAMAVLLRRAAELMPLGTKIRAEWLRDASAILASIDNP